MSIHTREGWTGILPAGFQQKKNESKKSRVSLSLHPFPPPPWPYAPLLPSVHTWLLYSHVHSPSLFSVWPDIWHGRLQPRLLKLRKIISNRRKKQWNMVGTINWGVTVFAAYNSLFIGSTYYMKYEQEHLYYIPLRMAVIDVYAVFYIICSLQIKCTVSLWISNKECLLTWAKSTESKVATICYTIFVPLHFCNYINYHTKVHIIQYYKRHYLNIWYKQTGLKYKTSKVHTRWLPLANMLLSTHWNRGRGSNLSTDCNS